MDWLGHDNLVNTKLSLSRYNDDNVSTASQLISARVIFALLESRALALGSYLKLP